MCNDISKTAKEHRSTRQEVQQPDLHPFETLADSGLVAPALLGRKRAHRRDLTLGGTDDWEAQRPGARDPNEALQTRWCLRSKLVRPLNPMGSTHRYSLPSSSTPRISSGTPTTFCQEAQRQSVYSIGEPCPRAAGQSTGWTRPPSCTIQALIGGVLRGPKQERGQYDE